MKLKVTPLEIETLINRDDFDSVDIGVKKGLSFEEAVQRTGGLGITHVSLFCLGLFHIYAVTFFVFAMVSNGYLYYSLPFLTLYP